MNMKPIPIDVAKKIAKDFEYDQVIVIARHVGDDGGEHVTTYGRNAQHCAVAAHVGDFLKFKVMGWDKQETHEDRRYAGLVKALEDVLDAVDDLRLANRLKEVERIATKALMVERGAFSEGERT